jgi:WD40 repeat protein
MSACFPEKALRQFLDALLPQSEQQAVAEHLAGCSVCQDVLEQLTEPVDGLGPKVGAALEGRGGSTVELGFLEGVKSLPPHAPFNTPQVPDEAPVDTAVPGYEILEELGRGGMGIVFKARQIKLDRLVALKVIWGGLRAAPSLLARFRLEAETIARLQHPHIVQVYDVGAQETCPYLAMEYVDGSSLAQRLADGPLPPGEAVALVETLARTMQVVHEHGILHRDLKPANILLTTETQRHREDKQAKGIKDSSSLCLCASVVSLSPKIADFGLAKRLDQAAGQTRTGMVMGTPGYLAPELAEGKGVQAGPVCDVYALGAILYECLTGQPPFRGETPLETLLQAIHEELLAPGRVRPGLPRDVETICLKCLAKEPQRRYGSAGELADDLHRYLRGEPIQARPVSAFERAWKWVLRRPAVAALLVLALFVAGAGFPVTTTLWLRADRTRQQAEEERGQKEQERQNAEQARLLLEGSVYADNIVLAQAAYEANDVPGALDRLERCLPVVGRTDRRGWEWYYLRRQCRADLLPGLAHKEGEWRYVHGVAFLPDGKRFASGAGVPFAGTSKRGPASKTPGELKVWDAAGGRCLATFADHPGAVWAVALSGDGKLLATGGADGSIHLRDAQTLAPRPSPAPEGNVYGLAFSPDGRLLAACRPAVVVWDLTGGIREKFRPTGPGKDATTLAFSPDGKRLATANIFSGEIHLWDLERGTRIEHHIPPGGLRALAFSPDGRWLALARDADSRIEVWDSAGTRLHQQLAGHSAGVHALAFAADGTLASASEDRTVRLWNSAVGGPGLVLRGHATGVLSVAFDRAGKRVLSGDKEGGVRVWDVTHDPRGLRCRLTEQGFTEWLGSLAFSADSRQLLALDLSPPRTELAAWDARTGVLQSRRSLNLQGHEDLPSFRYAFSGDGRRLAGPRPTEPGAIQVWDVATGAESATVRTGRVTARQATLSADGGRLAWVGWSLENGSLAVELGCADATTGRALARFALPAGHLFLHPSLSADGRLVAAAAVPVRIEGKQMVFSGRAVPRVWDTESGQEAIVLEGDLAPDTAGAAFSPDGKRLAFNTMSGGLSVWSLSEGKLCYPPLTATTSFGSPAFSPDGRRLAAAGRDGRVRLWDAANGNVLLTWPSAGLPGGDQYNFVPRVVFSPDGSRLATTNWNGWGAIWQAESQE